MKRILIFIISVFLFSCNDGKNKETNNSEGKDAEKETNVQNTMSPQDTITYTHATYHFSLRHPKNYEIFQGNLSGNIPVINIFKSSSNIEPPLAIHEDHAHGYIAMLPEGFGVEAPSGKQMAISDWKGHLPLSFQFNREKSRVYLLENNQPWAFAIYFYTSPSNWSRYGMLFVQFSVNNFKAQCYDSKGQVKPMENCDPFGIHTDTVKYFGNVSEPSRENLMNILQSLYFFRETPKRKPLSELIKIESPTPQTKINSPLQISGKAKGYWFFEADAPIKLVDSNYKTISESYIQATGNWMIEDWVPFSGEIKFNQSKDSHGFLIFNKANAAGKPEFDRKLILPVKF